MQQFMKVGKVNQIGEQGFNLANETGERGAQEDSNQILDKEQLLVTQKKDKCKEIFRNNSDIREIITSNIQNPDGFDLT